MCERKKSGSESEKTLLSLVRLGSLIFWMGLAVRLLAERNWN